MYETLYDADVKDYILYGWDMHCHCYDFIFTFFYLPIQTTNYTDDYFCLLFQTNNAFALFPLLNKQ